MLKSTINGNNIKGPKSEEENVALASKHPTQGRGSTKRRRKKKENQGKQATSAEIVKYSSRLEEEFVMFTDIPTKVRWVDWCCSPRELQKLGRILEESTSWINTWLQGPTVFNRKMDQWQLMQSMPE